MKCFKINQPTALGALAIGCAMLAASPSYAQSYNRSHQQSRSSEMGSASKTFEQVAVANNTTVGIDGYCPVCVIAKKEWVAGSPNHAAAFDGRTYFFPSEDIKNMFVANPTKFVPALNGDCIACYAKMGKRVAGNVRFSSLYKDRLYLFPGAGEKKMFDESPDQFADADIAADGNCIVCQVKMNKAVPGKLEFTAIHNGLRYLFPSAAERKMFTDAPAMFTSDNTPQMMDKHSSNMRSSTMQEISIRGETACSGCSFGITPIGAPDELGLAVINDDGNIYIIEDSHTRWPDLYEMRFEGKQVSVSGSVIKSEGKAVWIKPDRLSVL